MRLTRLLFGILGLAVGLSSHAQAKSFVVAVPDIPVLHTVDLERGIIGGDCYNKVRALLPEKHLLRSMPWNQALQGLLDKRIDMLPCGEYSEARAAKGIHYIGPITQYPMVLISRSDLALTLNNLASATGAFVLGDDEPERFNLNPEHYFWVNTPQQLIQTIIDGKADYTIAPKPIVNNVPESASKIYTIQEIDIRKVYLLLRPGIEDKLDVEALQEKSDQLFK